jgi:hypothetical protein
MYMMNGTIPPGVLPTTWMSMSIQDLAIYMVEIGKTMFTTTILPEWNTMYAAMGTYGISLPSTYGLKVKIDNIKAETTSSFGDQRGTEFDFSIFFSMDMENWTNVNEMIFGSSTSTNGTLTTSWLSMLLDVAMQGYIVDPSSYSDPIMALRDQAVFTKGLIVATTYDWSAISTDIAIEANGNVDAFEISASWNSMGLLSQGTVSSDGVTAITISLWTGEQEIPGYETTIIMILMPVTVIGIIYYIRKKNR